MQVRMAGLINYKIPSSFHFYFFSVLLSIFLTFFFFSNLFSQSNEKSIPTQLIGTEISFSYRTREVFHGFSYSQQYKKTTFSTGLNFGVKSTYSQGSIFPQIHFKLAYLPINKNTNNLYSEYTVSIQNTIDNFGLFWIIIESICGENIFKNYFRDDTYLIRDKDLNEFNNYLNFYFNLDNSINPTILMQQIARLFNYSDYPNFRIEFIEYIRSKISPENFSFYFDNNEQLYINFMEKVLALVRVDPTTRIPKEKLLEDLFFTKNG